MVRNDSSKVIKILAEKFMKSSEKKLQNPQKSHRLKYLIEREL